MASKDKTPYTLASDYQGRNDPVEYVFERPNLGISATYEREGPKTLNYPFTSSEEATSFIADNPPPYSEHQRAIFNADIDKMTRGLPSTSIYHRSLNPSDIKEINAAAKHKMNVATGVVSDNNNEPVLGESVVNGIFKSITKTQSILNVAQVDETVMRDPFHYKGKALKEILTKKSVTIQEVMYCFHPLSIVDVDARDIITGENIITMFKRAGIDNYKNIKERTTGIFVCHCKLEEPYDDVGNEAQNELNVPLLEREAYKEKKEQNNRMDVNSFPIVQEIIKEIEIDLNNQEDIELFVQSRMELKILLKDLTVDKVRNDEKLEGRKFTFICYFFV